MAAREGRSAVKEKKVAARHTERSALGVNEIDPPLLLFRPEYAAFGPSDTDRWDGHILVSLTLVSGESCLKKGRFT
jgi:hypothetical protein